jgi:hypothetical protein
MRSAALPPLQSSSFFVSAISRLETALPKGARRAFRDPVRNLTDTEQGRKRGVLTGGENADPSVGVLSGGQSGSGCPPGSGHAPHLAGRNPWESSNQTCDAPLQRPGAVGQGLRAGPVCPLARPRASLPRVAPGRGRLRPGAVQFVRVGPNTWVANMVGQHGLRGGKGHPSATTPWSSAWRRSPRRPGICPLPSTCRGSAAAWPAGARQERKDRTQSLPHDTPRGFLRRWGRRPQHACTGICL